MWDEDGVPDDGRDAIQWLNATPWMRAAFPGMAERRRRLLQAVDSRLQASAPALARPTRAIVGSALADLPGVHHDAVALLIRRLSEIRRIGDSLELQLVHCLIAALDACTPSDDAHPLLAGLRAAGWTAVPSPLVGVVVELALALLQWRQGRRDAPDDAADGLLDFRGFEVQLHRLAGAAAEQVGAPPGLAWIREVPAEPAAPRLVRDLPPAAPFLAAALRVVSPEDPRALPLLEAYADECLPDEAEFIEAAVLSLARSSSAGEGDPYLRAALRAWQRGDPSRADARSEAAFFAGEDPARRQTAAALLGLLRRRSDPQAARAWWLTAKALSDDRDDAFVRGLRELLEDPMAPLGLYYLSRPDWREFVVSSSPVPEPPRFVADDGELREIWTSLVREDLGVAYQRFSEALARVIEARDVAETAVIFEARRATWTQVMRGLAPDPDVALDARTLTATLASWLCGALADLHDHTGDHERWCKYKRRQLALEDEEWAAPEATQKDAGAWVMISVGDKGFDLAARARHCIEEAQDALADGRSDKARFWTSQASRYRERLRRGP
ncbi:hypothetical protein [Nannocystis punicea]|uniref:Uncharacterized protein n=1 Tax=Nannocystis punicea TaxID=2995304 RepID=A0ABY7GWA3_9BACT|nr:hypothetical protein [Nannocystis poenicansa]WAS91253.1 hypothetical protein O0S08_34130 [Nannocystis poenicansa]